MGAVKKAVKSVAKVVAPGLYYTNKAVKNVVDPKSPNYGTQAYPYQPSEAALMRMKPQVNPANADLSFTEWEAMKRAGDSAGGLSPTLVAGNSPLARAEGKYNSIAQAIGAAQQFTPPPPPPASGASQPTGSQPVTNPPPAPVVNPPAPAPQSPFSAAAQQNPFFRQPIARAPMLLPGPGQGPFAFNRQQLIAPAKPLVAPIPPQ